MTAPAVTRGAGALAGSHARRAASGGATLLGCMLQRASAAIETLKTHGDLNAAMMQSDRVGVLVWFGGAYESLQLPASESDTREAAWFTKLDHIWQRDVLTNKIAWIQAKNIKLRFARADPALMPARRRRGSSRTASRRASSCSGRRVQRAVRAAGFEGRHAHLPAVGQPGLERREGGAVSALACRGAS